MKQPKSYSENWRRFLEGSLLILSITLAVGCASNDLGSTIKIQQSEIIHPPSPEPLNLLDVQIMVLNKDKTQELAQSMGDDTAIFALTPKSYENLALNMQEIKRFLAQQQEIVLYYKGIFEDEDDKEVTSE